MRINNINSYYSLHNISNQNNQTNPINYNSINFMAAPRVDKSMKRFYEFNFNRFPTTVKIFIDGLIDKFKFSPIETQQNAFMALNQARNITDVKNLFPKEELFQDLKNVEDTKATVGLLGIYREFKDLYTNGMLNNGEDISIYLLKKIFLEAKTLDEINLDIENDLNKDIKSEFQRRYNDSDYICGSTLNSLGIRLPDSAYLNSLKFTREGYSDEFGLKVSEGCSKYWNGLSEEQKFEVLSKRLEGRDNWWNSLTHDEKLEFAVGIDSDEDLYRIYKKYIRQCKKEIQEGTFRQELERPIKKIKVGSRLKDKDIFILWFKKNIEKYYEFLSEADKDTVHIKRVRKLAVRWQEMTPEERTELINKMREGREPLRYAMIEAWNHSEQLIKELSKFLSEQQILKPIDLLYDTKEFSEFQSKVMTEFWESHKDLAEEFGENIKRAIAKVEESISRGQFEDLKQEIKRNKAYRIKLINREKLREAEQKQLEAQKNTQTVDYKKEFKESYNSAINPNNILPGSYINDMTETMLATYSTDFIEQLTYCFKTQLYDVRYPDIPQQAMRFQHALEVAIASELCSKGADLELYSLQTDKLIEIYSKQMQQSVPLQQRPNMHRIQKLYDEYKQSLLKKEAENIKNQYFIINNGEGNNDDTAKMLLDYIQSYGRSALIIFSEKSIHPDKTKIMLYQKFIDNMPNLIKKSCIPVFQTPMDIIEEKSIQQVKSDLAKRYNFLPEDFLNIYTNQVAHCIRCHRATNHVDKDIYSVKNYKEKMCKKIDAKQENIIPIMIPKYTLGLNTRIQFLAMEEALADELFKITNNEAVYMLELEELCNTFEAFSNGNNMLDININDGATRVLLLAQAKPNKNFLSNKYRKYLNEIKKSSSEIFSDNNIKDKTELMYCLNWVDGNTKRDEYILKRIEGYVW